MHLEGLAQVGGVELAGADLRAVDVLLPARGGIISEEMRQVISGGVLFD